MVKTISPEHMVQEPSQTHFINSEILICLEPVYLALW